ncbi:hypothetical protein [Paraburkholderia hospita]|uniref:hypothetical protein n=1 Tax=Paraburkholderia hospita TaxID=169430 RepID=UPI00115FACB6|nr:hypothetical protein [Paraburkholderia hospita]
MTKGDVDSPNIPGVWVGQRKDMYLPLLYLRANAADLGARPVVGPFWESPDIFVLAGVDPAKAPDRVFPIPGEIAIANSPNTIYANIWNFGNCAASEVIVEFYWCDPHLGINSASTHLIAQTVTSLGPKTHGIACHRVVKCPKAWSPMYLNGGHECLLVRVWDNPSDLPGEPLLDASLNRHVGQHNIHVVTAIQPANRALLPATSNLAGAFDNPLILKVGPLYGAPAQVNVERITPHNMPLLQLHTGKRGVFPAAAPPTGAAMLSRPMTIGGGIPSSGFGTNHDVVGDDQQVAFTTTDQKPGPGQAHVYRINAKQDGVVFGGYTVVILG